MLIITSLFFRYDLQYRTITRVLVTNFISNRISTFEETLSSNVCKNALMLNRQWIWKTTASRMGLKNRAMLIVFNYSETVYNGHSQKPQN